MNAERLHAIARAVRDEVADTETPRYLQEVVTALQQQVQYPSDAEYQQQVSAALAQLTESLSNAPSNSFSPAWQRVRGGDLAPCVR